MRNTLTMKNTLLIFALFSILLTNAQNKNWINEIQHSNKVNFNNFGDVSNYKWAKHIERYRWKEKDCLNEDGSLIPQNERIKNHLAQRTKSAQTYGNWLPIGLESWTNGSSGYNPGNGRINAITIDPNNSQVIYACAASGGVWKSNDGGATWNTNTDQFPVLGTSDLAIDPSNSNNLYLATGDRDGLDTYGVGIYKSTDAGSNWFPSGLFNNFDSEALIINAIEIDANQTNVIFAGSNDGLYKSTDFGETFYKVINSGHIMEVKINPQNSNTVFAVSKNYFYRSQDGGESFEIISNGLLTSIGRIAMDITPADTSYIYLLIADGSSNFNGVYRSTDGGSSFSQQVGIADINLLGYVQDGSDEDSQAWYDLAIAVSETDRDKIYTGGVNVWTSDNGGLSWTNSSHWYYVNNDNTYSHADIHSLDFYGSTLVCGSDGGAFINYSGNNWENISSGLNISQIYSFSNSSNGSKISTGCQDNGTNISNNGVWTHVKGADGMATVINQSNSNKVYLSWQYGEFNKSTTGGDNSSHIFSPGDYGETGNWLTPIDISKSEPTKLIIGLENIFRTTNEGSSWTSISNFSDGENFNVVAIAPSDPNYMYAAKPNHTYFSSDGGNTWIESGNPYLKPITAIAVSETDPLDVYFLKSSSYSKVYHSTDGGITSVTISTSLTQTTSSAIVLENNSINGIYIGTEFGVYYTNDLLGTWIFYSEQLPKVKVTDLEIVNQKLRAATYGRGVWESDLYETSVNINKLSQENKLNIYPNPASDNITIKIKDLNPLGIQIFNSSGILVFQTIENEENISISHLVSGSYFIKIKLSNGENIVKHFIKE